MGGAVSMINGHIDGPSNKYESCKWAAYDKHLCEWKCKLFYIRLKPTKCEHCKNYE